eukprot:scaffold18716_cov128-Isochrysis_galbana.AAC.1
MESSGQIRSSPSRMRLPESESPPKRRGTRTGVSSRTAPRPLARPRPPLAPPRAIGCCGTGPDNGGWPLRAVRGSADPCGRRRLGPGGGAGASWVLAALARRAGGLRKGGSHGQRPKSARTGAATVELGLQRVARRAVCTCCEGDLPSSSRWRLFVDWVPSFGSEGPEGWG